MYKYTKLQTICQPDYLLDSRGVGVGCSEITTQAKSGLDDEEGSDNNDLN
jgi:hypothetical protein